MLVESMLYAPLNATPAAREAGQYIARAGLQTESAERNMDILRAVGAGAEAFSATGAWLAGSRPQAGTMSAQELASVKASYQVPGAPWDDFSPNVSWGHVFEGELRPGPNGTTRALGYHHESQFSPSTTRVISGTETSLDANGVYQARVQIQDPATGIWIDKKASSSFFPKSWTPEQVNAEVMSAFGNKTWLVVPSQPGLPRSWEGIGDAGIRVRGHFNNGRIDTAYPIWRKR
jgi:hypothetical protein